MFDLNKNMCELIGCIIGDGNIYDKRVCYVELTGHPENDFSFFQNKLMTIVKTELNYIGRLSIRSHGVRLRINNKAFVSWLKDIGIPSGAKKFERVLIPKIIISGSAECVSACLRGIFDTDGCVYFDKRKIYKNPYIRIELHMYNLKLLSQISYLLSTLGVESNISKKKSALYINGKEKVQKYLKIIGFSNLRHTTRINLVYPDMLIDAPVAQLVEQKLIEH